VDEDEGELPDLRPEINWGLPEVEPNTIAALELEEKKKFLTNLQMGYGWQRAGQIIGWSPYHTEQVMKDPDIIQLLQIIEDMKDEDVERALYIAARSGNVTAASFWLLNRRKERWKDTKRIVVERDEKISIEVLHSVKQSALELLQAAGVKALQPGGALDVIDVDSEEIE
jgi:hypothetical protein